MHYRYANRVDELTGNRAHKQIGHTWLTGFQDALQENRVGYFRKRCTKRASRGEQQLPCPVQKHEILGIDIR